MGSIVGKPALPEIVLDRRLGKVTFVSENSCYVQYRGARLFRIEVNGGVALGRKLGKDCFKILDFIPDGEDDTPPNKPCMYLVKEEENNRPASMGSNSSQQKKACDSSDKENEEHKESIGRINPDRHIISVEEAEMLPTPCNSGPTSAFRERMNSTPHIVELPANIRSSLNASYGFVFGDSVADRRRRSSVMSMQTPIPIMTSAEQRRACLGPLSAAEASMDHGEEGADLNDFHDCKEQDDCNAGEIHDDSEDWVVPGSESSGSTATETLGIAGTNPTNGHERSKVCEYIDDDSYHESDDEYEENSMHDDNTIMEDEEDMDPFDFPVQQNFNQLDAMYDVPEEDCVGEDYQYVKASIVCGDEERRKAVSHERAEMQRRERSQLMNRSSQGRDECSQGRNTYSQGRNERKTEQLSSENEKDVYLMEQMEAKRQLEEMKEKRQLEEMEKKQQLEEMEKKRQLEEMKEKRQLEEMEKKRQLEEMEKKRQLEEMEKKRQLEEMEKKRQLEEMEKKQQLEEMEKKRQIGEMEQQQLEVLVERSNNEVSGVHIKAEHDDDTPDAWKAEKHSKVIRKEHVHGSSDEEETPKIITDKLSEVPPWRRKSVEAFRQFRSQRQSQKQQYRGLPGFEGYAASVGLPLTTQGGGLDLSQILRSINKPNQDRLEDTEATPSSLLALGSPPSVADILDRGLHSAPLRACPEEPFVKEKQEPRTPLADVKSDFTTLRERVRRSVQQLDQSSSSGVSSPTKEPEGVPDVIEAPFEAPFKDVIEAPFEPAIPAPATPAKPKRTTRGRGRRVTVVPKIGNKGSSRETSPCKRVTRSSARRAKQHTDLS